MLSETSLTDLNIPWWGLYPIHNSVGEPLIMSVDFSQHVRKGSWGLGVLPRTFSLHKWEGTEQGGKSSSPWICCLHLGVTLGRRWGHGPIQPMPGRRQGFPVLLAQVCTPETSFSGFSGVSFPHLLSTFPLFFKKIFCVTWNHCQNHSFVVLCNWTDQSKVMCKGAMIK